ncbi:MAG TPA: 5'-methylthioadenosine/adenosylhomocysteine nucleosidase [Clostridiales bacterium]|nr:5'-methylthioadenosine/adenosylhomocysteine nucleosidase [Clostridiales bacterium]
MKKVGIIGAMPSELADIRRILGEAKVENYSGFDFYINEINGVKTINACCGIAKVNAAVCTQVMIDRFNVDAIINAGIAGGMNSDVKVCDVVISNEVLPHDLELRFLENYPPYCSVFKADDKLIKLAQKLCGEFDINCFVGRIVSGEAFISSNDIKMQIAEKYNPYAVDMESSAVGHCAFMNKTPFVSVRCISDNADDEGAMSFDEFEKIAAKRVAEIVLEMAKGI